MITSNLDVSNLNASKPSLNKKADLSFNDSQSSSKNGFEEELASFQSAANMPTNINSPNQVSEENAKTLTENLNNFSATQIAIPNLGESLDQETESNPSLDADAAKVALQGMVATPIVNNVVAQEVAKPAVNAGNPQLNQQMNFQAMAPSMARLSQPADAAADTGKFSLEGFQSVVPQTLSPELAAAMMLKNNQSTELAPAVADIPVSEQQVTEELSKQSFENAKGTAASLAAPASSEVMSFLQNMAPQTETPVAVAAENSAPTEMSAMFATPQSAALTPLQQNQTKNESGDSKEFSSKDHERSTDVGNEQTFGHIAEKHKLNEAQVKTAEAAVALPTEAQHKSNMDQIVTHARTFLKDGGGEMVMKLTPEGLGTVDLKVAVKDGQVSIEINTQNEHVKKMFEEGAKDLRGALEVQNLRVDTVKVNMAEHAPKNMNMNQFNMSDKDFARNFMGQFRDERQGFRSQSLNGVMDKFHSPAKEAGGLRPAGLAMGNSSRLNVVA